MTAPERYRCRECGRVVVGSAGLSEHRREHREQGRAVPEWDVL